MKARSLDRSLYKIYGLMVIARFMDRRFSKLYCLIVIQGQWIQGIAEKMRGFWIEDVAKYMG